MAANVQDFHPDLQRMARFLPRGVVGPRTLPLIRMVQKGMGRLQRDAEVEVRSLPSGGEARVFRPSGVTGDAPGLLWIHGGGYVIGEAQQDDELCRRFSRDLGAVVVSVDYRLAPEHPFPAPLDDCHEALDVLHQLDGVADGQFAIGGASAGGGLAAQLALRIRDRGGATPVLQLLVYPMLDDRTVRTSVDEDDLRMWHAKSNRFGWDSYLGGADPEIVAPARRDDLSGLAPAWIGVGGMDLFHDEDLQYAERLRAAGVPCELEVIPGAFHGFDLVNPAAPVSREFFRFQAAALRAAFLGSR
ncbi:alpha/beta hydrolase [Gordonia hankookensis]|uniref:Alpha/beta hydrolase n=1 Tax=Gordonia hankookensis TaxID=589403 RepID=A0ABR7WE96_9ACTN|nr:alpha/beta hydrolase [Gordonia hankookensis]MBD1321109.1 alpha/beta hydrolase [Gordonia hankookensis]